MIEAKPRDHNLTRVCEPPNRNGPHKHVHTNGHGNLFLQGLKEKSYRKSGYSALSQAYLAL